MPDGSSIEDVADDYAAVVATEFGGPPWPAATTERGLTMAEALLPGGGLGWLRRLLVPLTARMWDWMYGPGEHEYFEHDFAVEADAALGFDSREALPRIRVPVLLVNGDRDRYFSRDLIEETAELIPDRTVVWYPGKATTTSAAARGSDQSSSTTSASDRPAPARRDHDRPAKSTKATRASAAVGLFSTMACSATFVRMTALLPAAAGDVSSSQRLQVAVAAYLARYRDASASTRAVGPAGVPEMVPGAGDWIR
jgi:hypothetical protein